MMISKRKMHGGKAGSKVEKVVRGPKPGIFKIEGDWRDAIKKSLAKKKPLNGWPK